MLMLTQLCGFGSFDAAVVPPPSLTFLQAAEDVTTLTTYSFATQNIGTADATRRVVVVIHWSRSTTSRTLSSATIGGVAATIHLQASGASLASVAIVSALVPTGTTATIAFTLSGDANRAAIAAYRAVNEVVATHHATMNDTTVASGLLSGTIDIPANGWVVGGVTYSGAAGSSFTWTGANESYADTAFSGAAGVYRTSAHQELLALQTGRTVSALCSNTAAANGALVAISWG